MDVSGSESSICDESVPKSRSGLSLAIAVIPNPNSITMVIAYTASLFLENILLIICAITFFITFSLLLLLRQLPDALIFSHNTI